MIQLADMPETLDMETGCGIVPRFYTDTITSYGYLGEPFSISEEVAPQITAGTFYELFDPRTFTELPGMAPNSEAHKGSRTTLPPSPFDPDIHNGEESHLAPRYESSYRGDEKLQMIHDITSSLLRGNARSETLKGQEQQPLKLRSKGDQVGEKLIVPLIVFIYRPQLNQSSCAY